MINTYEDLYRIDFARKHAAACAYSVNFDEAAPAPSPVQSYIDQRDALQNEISSRGVRSMLGGLAGGLGTIGLGMAGVNPWVAAAPAALGIGHSIYQTYKNVQAADKLNNLRNPYTSGDPLSPSDVALYKIDQARREINDMDQRQQQLNREAYRYYMLSSGENGEDMSNMARIAAGNRSSIENYRQQIAAKEKEIEELNRQYHQMKAQA